MANAGKSVRHDRKTKHVGKRKEWSLGVIQSLADALTAYLTLQARTGMSAAYSEYLLYDPVVRVCRSRGWKVSGEVAVPPRATGPGDDPRIDFVIRKSANSRWYVLIEIKYRKNLKNPVKIEQDLLKLRSMLAKYGDQARAFILVAGRERRLAKRTQGFVTTPSLDEGLCYSTTYKAAATTFGVSAFRVLANVR